MKCKVCDKELARINTSHVKTHKMTMEEYNNIDNIKIEKEEVKLETIWDSIDTSTVEYKMKVSKLSNNIKQVKQSNMIKFDDKDNCPVCLEKIFETYAFVHLKNKWEQKSGKLERPQVVMHRPCAIATGTVNFLLGRVSTIRKN